MLSQPRSRVTAWIASSRAARVLIALLAVAASTLLRLALSPLVGHDVPFILYFPTIALVAWYAGTGAGLLAVFTSAVAVWLFVTPQHDDPITAVRLGLFVLGSCTIAWVMNSLHGAQRSLDEARQSEERHRVWFELMLGSIAEGVIATDASGSITFMNQAARDMVGPAAVGAIGRPFSQVVVLIDETTETPIADLGKLYPSQRLVIANPEKENMPVAASVSMMPGTAHSDPESVLILRVAFDDRERFLLIEEAGAARRDAEAANRMKDDFLRMVSHELRAPLNAILGWADVMQRKTDPETLRKGTETIRRNVRAQSALIDSMLDVAAIASGKFVIEPREVYLPDIIDDALRSIEPTASSKSIKLAYDIDRQDLSVRADPNRMQQVLANLYSNAMKFTPTGGTISTALQYMDNEVVISVCDTGQGMSADVMALLFERSGQGEPSLQRSKSGLGLGLPIARRIIELHGGKLLASSDGDQKGTMFVLTFPMSAKSPALPAAGDGSRPLADLAGKKVLVVDDDTQAALLLANVLSGHGAEVQTADSARRALEIYRRWQPDGMVSDIGMPGEDGHWLIAQIRDQARRHGEIPIAALAVTAYGRPEDRERSRAAGFDGHLGKPVSSHAVTHALSAALAKRESDRSQPKDR
jgi:signal transduction histidine kinase/CheY-like chemotaxis protein